MNELVKFWKNFDFHAPPFVHSQDKPRLLESALKQPFLDHRRFVISPLFGKENDKSLHLSLLPVPYQGDLENADIFVLLLNPGLGLGDYHTQKDIKHSSLLKKIIRQELKSVKYPFLSLDPEFSWSGGFVWWERKLRSLLHAIANEHFQGSYLAAMQYLSKRMAAIELFPYHSKSFHATKHNLSLPSVLAVKRFIQTSLLEKARRGDATIIVMRQVTTFELPNCPNIIKYKGGETRAAHLGAQSRAGKAILKRIRTSII